jgi:hypothetical protein
MTSTYDSGYQQAHRTLGLEKYANPVARFLVRNAPNFLHSLRSNIFGHPLQAVRQLQAGKLFGKGGLVRQGLQAPGWPSKLLLYGIPAGMAAYTAAGDDPDKYEQIGGLAAGTLLGNAAFGPAGMLGGMAGYTVGTPIGRHIGGAIRHGITGEPSQAEGPTPIPAHRFPGPLEGPAPYPVVQYGQMMGQVGGGLGY